VLISLLFCWCCWTCSFSLSFLIKGWLTFLFSICVVTWLWNGFKCLRLLAHCCCKVAIGFSAVAWLDFRAVLSTTWYVHHSFHLFGDLFSISTSGIVKFDTSIMVDSHDNRCLFADTSWGKEVHISNWYHDCSCIQGCSCSTVGLITSAIYSCMLHIVQCLLAYIFCTLWYVGRMRINCYMCTATRYGKWCGYLGGNTWVIEWFIGESQSLIVTGPLCGLGWSRSQVGHEVQASKLWSKWICHPSAGVN
jgi:hypothetical protein